MKVLFISPNTEEIVMPTPPLGLAWVVAATKKAGHTVEVLDFKAVKDPHLALKDTIARFGPEIIGISVRNIDDQRMDDTKFLLTPIKEVVSFCRELSKAKIILGGAGYSICPASILAYLGVGMGIQGEGEGVFPALLERIQKGHDLSDIPGLYLSDRGLMGTRRFPEDLDQLPFPDLEALTSYLPKDREILLPVQTRRGCPLDCSYCSTAFIEGRHIRKRSTDRVIQELTRYKEAGFSRFYFVDNTFNLPSSYARTLCSKMAMAGLEIAWQCILYPVEIEKDLVKEMARAGCKEASVGFESGSERILRKMNKRFKPEEVRVTCERLKDHGIRRLGFLLLGGPDETRESVEESLGFADSLCLDALKISIGIRIYPHTELAKVAVEEGIIAPEDDLLFPKFYLAKGLKGWIHQTVREWTADRPYCLT